MTTATVIACRSQKRAKRSGSSLIPSKRWSTFIRMIRRNRYVPSRTAQTTTSNEATSCTGSAAPVRSSTTASRAKVRL